MKTTINGSRYDTEKCEVLGEYDHNNNGNYSGTTRLLLAGNGGLLVWTNSNGQDCYLRDSLRAWDPDGVEQDIIDSYTLSEIQEARCAELGLITIVE